MRRTAALLVLLLTAADAQAGISESDRFQILLGGVACCWGVPLSVALVLILAMAIYDRRKARRDQPPGNKSRRGGSLD
jgi:hypothetical protein